MRARLIRIGNSRGVRLPKPLIEEAGPQEEVEVRVRQSAVVITSAAKTPSGWSEAAQQLRERDADRLLAEPGATRFDDREWQWR